MTEFEQVIPSMDCKVCGTEDSAVPDGTVFAVDGDEPQTNMWRCNHCGNPFKGPRWS